MLKPFKSFLNYLQKNANGAAIFGLTTNMSNNIEEESIIVTTSETKIENDLSIDVETNQRSQEMMIDPFESVPSDSFKGDPLAFDESGIETSLLDSSIEEETQTEGRIIIVDVNALKKGCDENLSELNSSSETELDESYTSKETIILESNHEGEEPSDGSDSGIGPEPSSETDIFNLSSPMTSVLTFKTPRSSLKRRAECNELDDVDNGAKKTKRSIAFDGVTVYYFPRIQGFACVPSQGGCTLGMDAIHSHFRTFSLAEHAAEQRRAHRLQLQELNPRSSSSDDSDSDEEISENSGSELDAESNGFLQPVATKQRRALLKAAGIRKIDSSEKDECRLIRSSREICGCNCRGYCDPDTCYCSQSGIKCQVDRVNFPCGCTRDGCGNVIGRVEFNPGRVRTHFIHTIMRIELEKKQTNSDDLIDGRSWVPSIKLPILPNSDSSVYNHHSIIYSHIELNSALPTSSSLNSLQLSRPNSSTTGSGESLDLHYAYRDDYPVTSNNIIEPSRLPNSDTSNFKIHPFNHEANSLTYQTHTYNTYTSDFIETSQNSLILSNQTYDTSPTASITTTQEEQQPQISQENYLHSESFDMSSTVDTPTHLGNNLSDNIPIKELKNENLCDELSLPESFGLSHEDNDKNKTNANEDFINLRPPESNSPRLEAINDLLEHSRLSSATTSSYSSEDVLIDNNCLRITTIVTSLPPPKTDVISINSNEIDDTNDIINNNLIKTIIETETLNINNNIENNTESDDKCENSLVKIENKTNENNNIKDDVNENLSEIIKKGIVETVSA